MTASEPLPVVERTGVCLLDPADLPRASWALEALAVLDAPAPLAPLLRWEAGAVSVSLVHALPAGAVALDGVLARGPLDIGHAVAVGVAVGSALQALHDAGLAHGAVDGGSVVVAPDGSVQLAGTGLAWRAAPGAVDGPRPADDVAAFGALLRGLLGPRSAPAPLVVAALRATDPDPALRPSAADVVAAVRRCGAPEPLPYDRPPAVAVPEAPAPAGAAVPARPGVPPRRSGGDSRGREVDPASVARPGGRRRVVRGVVVALLVGVAGAAAVRAVPVRLADAVAAQAAPAASSSPGTAAPVAAPEPAATDWAAVLTALDEGRRRALQSGSEAELALWVDPDGGAWAHDRALQQRLVSSGSTLSGGALVLEQVVAEQVSGDRVVLAVRDRRTAYDVVQDGRRTRVPERPARWWTVVLTAVPSLDGDGWRIGDVRGAEERAAP